MLTVQLVAQNLDHRADLGFSLAVLTSPFEIAGSFRDGEVSIRPDFMIWQFITCKIVSAVVNYYNL